jgi:DNA recombination-dependent growth factor C
MVFISGSASFTRYRVIDETPSELWNEFGDRLKKNAFKDIDDLPEERAWGWVCFDNMLDAEWRTAPPEKANYMAFAFRLDTRRVPPAVIKKHVSLALEAEERRIKEEGRKFVSKDRKRELKDLVKSRLMTRFLPIPATFDVVWNMDQNLVYFDCTRSKVCDLFLEHFTLTFDLHIEPLTPSCLTLHLLGADAQARLDALQPTSFV